MSCLWIEAVKKGVFCVSIYAGGTGVTLLDKRAVTVLGERILLANDASRRLTADMFRLIDHGRSSAIFGAAGFRAGLLDPCDAARRAFELTAYALVAYEAPIEPPDEREPEHAQ